MSFLCFAPILCPSFRFFFFVIEVKWSPCFQDIITKSQFNSFIHSPNIYRILARCQMLCSEQETQKQMKHGHVLHKLPLVPENLPLYSGGLPGPFTTGVQPCVRKLLSPPLSSLPLRMEIYSRTSLVDWIQLLYHRSLCLECFQEKKINLNVFGDSPERLWIVSCLF